MSVTRSVTQPLSWLDRNESDRRAAGLRRSLRPRSASDAVVDLASNDYLGLSGHPDVIEGGVAALRTWGAGSTGSRLVTGDTDLHEQFEDELAEFVGAPSALVFSSGYAANIGAVVALSGPGSLIVSDAFSHASLVDACRLSRARVAVTPHNDVDAHNGSAQSITASQLRASARRAQQEMLLLSMASRQIIAAESKHSIQDCQPDLVVAVVRELVEGMRA